MRKSPAKNSKKSEFNAKAASKNEAACFLFQNTRKLLIYGRRSIIIILVNVSHHWNTTSTFLLALSSEHIVSNILLYGHRASIFAETGGEGRFFDKFYF